jgi:hypothetical protein
MPLILVVQLVLATQIIVRILVGAKLQKPDLWSGFTRRSARRAASFRVAMYSRSAIRHPIFRYSLFAIRTGAAQARSSPHNQDPPINNFVGASPRKSQSAVALRLPAHSIGKRPSPHSQNSNQLMECGGKRSKAERDPALALTNPSSGPNSRPRAKAGHKPWVQSQSYILKR